MKNFHISITEQSYGRQASVLLNYPQQAITLRQTLDIIADVFSDISEEHLYLSTAGVGDLMIHELRKAPETSEYSECKISESSLRKTVFFPKSQGLVSLFTVKLAAQDLGGLDASNQVTISCEQEMFTVSLLHKTPNK